MSLRPRLVYSSKPLGELSTVVEKLVVRVGEGAQGDDKRWSRLYLYCALGSVSVWLVTGHCAPTE